MIAQHFYAVLLLFGCIASFITLRGRKKSFSYNSVNSFNSTEDNFNNNLNNTYHVDDFFKYRKYIILNQDKIKNEIKKRNLYIQGLFEVETQDGPRWETQSELLAAKLAVDHINKYEIIPGYSLNLLTNNSKCDSGVGLDQLFHSLYSNKTIIMVLTGSCSTVTEALANVVPFWNILQVSYASTSPTLSDRKKFPLFFRTIAVTSSHNNAILGFMQYFKWETVILFIENEEYYLLPLNDLVKEMELVNISCAATVTFSQDNIFEQLKTLKDLEVRIIIGSFSANIALFVFCEALKLNMIGKEYVWIMQNDVNFQWKQNQSCNLKDLVFAAAGIFLVSDYTTIPDGLSVYNLTSDDFVNELKITNSSISKYAALAYDAVWTMAFTIRDAMESYQISPAQFFYRNNDYLEIFLEIMTNMRFMGLTGPIIFNEANRIGNTIFKQLQLKDLNITTRYEHTTATKNYLTSKGGQINPVAIYNPMHQSLNFKCKICKPIRWKNNQIPVARRILRKRLEAIPNILFYTILTISCLGIFFSFIILYFNLHFRRIKTIKLSSPYMNNTAIIGCIIVYLAVIILGLDSSFLPTKNEFTYLCIVRVYFLSAGFSLTFGSLFAKTYRIHRIFTYSRTNSIKNKLLKDKPLIALVCLLLIIDGIIIILWSLIDPMKYSLYDLPIEISPTNKRVGYQPQVETCRSENTSGWFIAMYGYKGILLMMVVYMAWETRHVKIPELNDSQYIGVCVYSVLSSSLFIVLANLIPNHPTLSYLTTTFSILASTTTIVILLFIPKLKSILASSDITDPIEKCMGLKTEYNTRRFIVDDPKDHIYRLEAQNKVYRNEIRLLDEEITRLEKQFSNTSKISNISTLGMFLKRKRRSFYEADTSSIFKNEIETTRASWPSEYYENDYKEMKNSLISPENDSMYNQMKKMFGNISQVWQFVADEENLNDKPSENEFCNLMLQDNDNNCEQRWLFKVTSAVQYSNKDSKFRINDLSNKDNCLAEKF